MTLETGGPASPNGEHHLATLREAYLERLTRPGQPLQLADAFPVPDDLAAVYAQLTELKACLDSFRPFDPAQAEKLRQAFDVEYTYNSNKIEGNTLTLGETHLVVNEGLTIAGKPLSEHLEAINHHEAIGLVRDLASRHEPLTETSLRHIHALVLHGIDRANAGVWRLGAVAILGSPHVPPPPLAIPNLMLDLFAFYDANHATMHPVELAAQMHEKLVTIHPFSDGNGRTARLVMNLILLGAGYPIAILSGDDAPRRDYYRTLDAARVSVPPSNHEFQRFVALNVRAWLIRYLELVSVDVSEHGKTKGQRFFEAIARHLNGNARP